MLTEGEYREKFPTGVVEKLSYFGLSLQYNYANLLRCELLWGHFDFTNFQNVESQKRAFDQLNLSLSYHFLHM